MKKAVLFLLLLATAYFGWAQLEQAGSPTSAARQPTEAQPENFFAPKHDGDQVRGSGIVSRILADDNDGSRHQRFILRLASGQTLLVAHNIDIAPRVAPLGTGDRVSFYGVYEWNDKGGVIHWTHRDPRGRHVDGWLERNGQRFR